MEPNNQPAGPFVQLAQDFFLQQQQEHSASRATGSFEDYISLTDD
jgi:hypothetical protein